MLIVALFPAYVTTAISPAWNVVLNALPAAGVVAGAMYLGLQKKALAACLAMVYLGCVGFTGGLSYAQGCVWAIARHAG